MKVIHVLYQSLPQISGSSIRSRDILMSQKEVDIDVLAITAPFQPSTTKNSMVEYFDSIKYIRTSNYIKDEISYKQKHIIKRVFRFLLIFKFTFNLYQIVKKEQPDVIHAHAMFFCSIPSLIIGKFFKLPVIYEMRSLWMFNKTNKSRGNKFLNNLLLKIEIYTLNKANHVIAINDNLKKELIKVGLKKEISIIPNAINAKLIASYKKNNVTTTREEIVFGYIGSIINHEGIQLLIKVFQELYDEGIKNKLLIFGNGSELENIKKQIALRKDIETIKYCGGVKPTKIYTAFAQLDVIINPRLKTKLTDKVTPLKPLEAMAYEKIVIGSDVGGIKELIKDKSNGFLFKADSKEDLKKIIKNVLIIDKDSKTKIIKNSLNYVIEHKNWLNNAKSYKEIYSNLIKTKKN